MTRLQHRWTPSGTCAFTQRTCVEGICSKMQFWESLEYLVCPGKYSFYSIRMYSSGMLPALQDLCTLGSLVTFQSTSAESYEGNGSSINIPVLKFKKKKKNHLVSDFLLAVYHSVIVICCSWACTVLENFLLGQYVFHISLSFIVCYCIKLFGMCTPIETS